MANSSFQALINSKKPIFIDFYADWCGPCKSFTPIVEKLKDDLGDKVRVIKIDIDKNQKLATQLGIKSIPAVMIYQEGKLKYEGKGMHSLEDLKSKLSKLI
jgi:thioredoxin 1